MTGDALVLHATTVAIGGVAVLLEGPSGAGKSDLALRLMDRGAMLVSDDYTQVGRVGERLIASAPPTIAGRIEVRGIGIIPVDHLPNAPVGLLLMLCENIERMPEPATRDILGVACPTLALDPRPASAVLKAELALKLLHRPWETMV